MERKNHELFAVPIGYSKKVKPSLPKLRIKFCINLVLCTIAIFAVLLLEDWELCQCTEDDRACEKLCYFKYICVSASILFLLPYFCDTVETVALVRESFAAGTIMFAEGSNEVLPASFVNFKRIPAINFFPYRVLLCVLYSLIMLMPFNLVKTGAWYTLPDLLLSWSLFPLAYAAIASSNGVIETFVNLVAVQVFAGLDNSLVEKALSRYTSIGEVIQRVYMEDPNDNLNNRKILLKALEDPTNLDASALTNDNIDYILTQISSFAFESVKLDFSNVTEPSDIVHKLKTYFESKEGGQIKGLTISGMGGGGASFHTNQLDFFAPLLRALRETNLNRLTLEGEYINDEFLGMLESYWSNSESSKPDQPMYLKELKLINPATHRVQGVSEDARKRLSTFLPSSIVVSVVESKKDGYPGLSGAEYNL